MAVLGWVSLIMTVAVVAVMIVVILGWDRQHMDWKINNISNTAYTNQKKIRKIRKLKER